MHSKVSTIHWLMTVDPQPATEIAIRSVNIATNQICKLKKHNQTGDEV